MMTFLSVIFLIASFPFQGIALAAKTASATAKAGKTAINPKVKSITRKRKKLTRVFKRNKIKAKKSTALLEKLKNSKANTKKFSPLKHKRLNTKINKAKSQVAKDKASVKTSKAKEKATKTQEKTLKTTKHSLQLTEITQNALHLAANGTATLLKGVSKIFSLLIPIDVYITLVVLVLVVVSAVVSVIYTNGGIADPNVKEEENVGDIANKDEIIVDSEGNIIENPDSEEQEEGEKYYKVEDTGWIYFSKQDERWADIDIGGGTTLGKDGDLITCMAMVFTHYSTTNTVTTPADIVNKVKSLDTYCDGMLIDDIWLDYILLPDSKIYQSDFTLSSSVGDGSSYSSIVPTAVDEGAVVITVSSCDSYDQTWGTDSSDVNNYVIIYKHDSSYRVLSPNVNHESGSEGDASKKPYSSYSWSYDDVLGVESYLGGSYILFE